MAEFKIIETQEDFDRAIQKRLEQKDKEVTARFKDYLSPEDVTALKADYDKQLKEARNDLAAITDKLSKHDTEVADLTARAVKAETTLLKNRIANDNGIPMTFADRLVGETEDELKKDAESLASYFTKPSAPPMRTNEPTIPGGSAPSSTDAAMMSLLSQLTTSNN